MVKVNLPQVSTENSGDGDGIVKNEREKTVLGVWVPNQKEEMVSE